MDGRHRLLSARVNGSATEWAPASSRCVQDQRAARAARLRSSTAATFKKQKIWFPKVSDPVPLLYQLSRTESRWQLLMCGAKASGTAIVGIALVSSMLLQSSLMKSR